MYVFLHTSNGHIGNLNVLAHALNHFLHTSIEIRHWGCDTKGVPDRELALLNPRGVRLGSDPRRRRTALLSNLDGPHV